MEARSALSAARNTGRLAAAAIGDGLYALRDRLLTDPGFQRWAARFPLTRPVARRQAAAAFDLCAGFIYAQALLAAVRLGLLQQVASGPILETELVHAIALPPGRAQMLVDAAVALGLLSRRARGRIGLGMRGAAITANPGIVAMVEHHALVYVDLADPVAVLAGRNRPTKLRTFWPYATTQEPYRLDGSSTDTYSELMSASQVMLCDDILDAYPFGQHRSIMDVGGGEGTFLSALARRYREPRLELFDLPSVATRAKKRFEAAGLGHRAHATGGSFFHDPLPEGHDAITLVRVVHDHDDDNVLALFSSIRAALAPGGTLVIAEPMSGTRDSSRVADVYFAFYLLAMGSGRPRSADSLAAMLRAAGFAEVRRVSTARPMLTSMLVAK